MAEYGPSIKAARLFEKTSKNGAMYLTGRLGGMKIAIVKSKDVAEDGTPMWSMLLSEAPQRAAGERQQAAQPRDDDRAGYAKPRLNGAAAPRQPALSSTGHNFTDEIPF